MLSANPNAAAGIDSSPVLDPIQHQLAASAQRTDENFRRRTVQTPVMVTYLNSTAECADRSARGGRWSDSRDFQEQFLFNMRMRELMTEVNQLIARVREAQNKLRSSATGTNTGASTSNPAATGNDLSATALDAIAAKLLTERVRYGKPGLQAHVTYLAGMTANVDQQIGHAAIERYEVLKKELEIIRAEVNRIGLP